MTQVTWTLDKTILERLTPHGRPLTDIIRDRGYAVRLVDRHDNGEYDLVLPGPDECSVLFGAHSFVKSVNPKGAFQPGHLGVNDRTQATAYMSNLPLEWFLNRRATFMTWSMFKQRVDELWQIHDGLFIRPNSGLKTFAGQRIKRYDPEETIATLDEHSAVMDETLILYNPLVDIQGEFRFVIADGQVIAGSEYRWDGKLDIRRDWPPICEALAQQVASHPWQVDIAYTCDVALVAGKAWLVELNGFSCAGLYACDLDKVVEGVSQAALKEFRGDL
jgi:hypothetical protein